MALRKNSQDSYEDALSRINRISPPIVVSDHLRRASKWFGGQSSLGAESLLTPQILGLDGILPALLQWALGYPSLCRANLESVHYF